MKREETDKLNRTKLLGLPSRDGLRPDEREAFDQVLERTRRLLASDAPTDGYFEPAVEHDVSADFWHVLLHSPAMAVNLSRMGTLVRTAGERNETYSHAERELADQVAAVVLRSNHVLAMHTPDAVAAGVSIETIEAIRADNLDALPPRERLFARYVSQVLTGAVDDATWSEMRDALGTRGLVEYTVFVCHLMLCIRVMQAFAFDEPDDEVIGEIIAGLRQQPPADFRSRLC